MPLYEGGAIYSQTRQAEQTVGQRRSQVDDARRAAVQTATQFWSTLEAARASISSFAAAVRAAQIALEGTQQEALVGTRTVLDVLIANQQLLTTQSQLVTAQHDAALAEFNLAAAVGRLIAPELNLPVQALRYGAALQGGEGQMDRLPRRSFRVRRLAPGGSAGKSSAVLPRLEGVQAFFGLPPCRKMPNRRQNPLWKR